MAPRFTLGIVTNGNTYLERCGLAGRFSVVTLAQAGGARKLDPRIYLAACEDAGCRADELIHVGDSLVEDVGGANGIGAVSVWLNRGPTPRCGGVERDFEVSSLGGLLELLGMAARPCR